MHSTNYCATFIAVSPDSDAATGKVPGKPGSVAWLQWRMVSDHPYRFTSDDVIFAVHAERNGIAEPDRPAARAAFFAKGQPCLRSSPLVKTHGWGIHHDAQGRVALFAVDSSRYAELLDCGDPTVVVGIRSKRG